MVFVDVKLLPINHKLRKQKGKLKELKRLNRMNLFNFILKKRLGNPVFVVAFLKYLGNALGKTLY